MEESSDVRCGYNVGGNSEVPAVDTEATGAAIIEINGSNATLTGSFADLESNFNTEFRKYGLIISSFFVRTNYMCT